jgi:glycosyltransferase involved in cell wall biosynthesis
MDSLVSVIIPVHDSENTIKRCLDSVFASAYKNIEVIVVDDASSDSSFSIAKSFPCKVIKKERNSGPADSRNLGADSAVGDIFLFIDSDTELFTDTITTIVKDMIEESLSAVVGIYAKQPINKGFFPEYYALLKYFSFAGQGKHKHAVFASHCAAIKKEVFKELKGFGKFKWGMDIENEEFGNRINKKYSIIMDPAIQVKHHFAGVGKLVYIFFNRTYWWTRFFLKHGKFEKTLTTKTMAAANICGFLLPFAVAIVLITGLSIFAWIIPLLLLLIFWKGYADFINFVLKERGLLFAAKSLMFALLVSPVITFAAGCAFLSNLFSKSDIVFQNV